MINVKDFGAAGDGKTPDTHAIQGAIEAVENSQRILTGTDIDQMGVGGTIYFPPGRYIITETIVILKDNITFRGDGTGSVILEYRPNIPWPLHPLPIKPNAIPDNKYFMFKVQSGRRTIHFEDLCFAKGGILFEDNIRHHNGIRRCVFVGTEDYAVKTGKKMISLEVDFCFFKNCRGGIYIDGPASDLIKISHCSFNRSRNYDIHVGSTTVWIEHCDFEIRPDNYKDYADAFIYIEPRETGPVATTNEDTANNSVYSIERTGISTLAAEIKKDEVEHTGGSGWGLIFNNRFGNEISGSILQEISGENLENKEPIDYDVEGGPPKYAIRVGDSSSKLNTIYHYCNIIGNAFHGLEDSTYPRLAYIKIERNVSYWNISANTFGDVASDGYIISEPDWETVRNVTTNSNAFLNNNILTSRPVFSAGGLGWPMVNGDAQQNVWRKNSPQPEYTDSNVLSRDLSTWVLVDCAATRNAQSPSGMLSDAFTISMKKNNLESSALATDPNTRRESPSLRLISDVTGDDGPWCFSIWFKANTVDTVRLGVRDPDANIFLTRQLEKFTRPKGEWHQLYVVVAKLPRHVTRAHCVVALDSSVGDEDREADCKLWDPRFEKGTRPQRRWIHSPSMANPILPTDGEMWIYDDGEIKQLRVQLHNQLYKTDLAPIIATASPTNIVASYGANNEGQRDTSIAFINAWNKHKTIYIPDGVYLVKDLDPPDGSTLLCESEDTIIKAVTPDDSIFVTNSAKRRCRISGGTWRDFKVLWMHRGDSAITGCKFEDMNIRNGDYAFDLSSAVGNLWHGNYFGSAGALNNLEYGIYFRGTGKGQTNHNSIVDNEFRYYEKKAIVFADTPVTKAQNNIERNWFEDSKGGAIYIGGSTTNLQVQSNYFETCGDAENPDIRLEQTSGHTINGVVIDKNDFKTAGADQSCRIKNTGNSSFTADSNTAVLANDQVFASIEGSAVFASKLTRNYLNNSGDSIELYLTKLFRQQGRQQIEWENYTGSGKVTGDESPEREYRGDTAYVPRDIDISSQTEIDCSGANIITLYSTSPVTIESITGLRKGKSVSLYNRTSHNITFKHSQYLRCDGAMDFVMGQASTITFLRFVDGGAAIMVAHSKT
ncbi:MAG: hypothetical protein AMJ53_02130 [Gammaproteobacteria bacterium SG8_11]|nr:MAG: hypothetical protein AMJ53_02130 [Gammaproteobacteria bacterium SG8_11]